MESSLSSIFIILALLSTGFLSGKFLAPPLRQVLLKSLSFIVLLLLFFMGYEFGSVFTDPNLGADIVKYALLFALIISAFTLIALYRKPEASTAPTPSGSFIKPFYGCFKAFAFFGLGVAAFAFFGRQIGNLPIDSTHILYLLIFMVGMDLVDFQLGGFGRRIFLLPLLTVAATSAACFVFSLCSPYSFAQSLVLSGGFGWFSLSGPMVGKAVSPEMGAAAFMTDFFREMISIVFLYFYGRKQPMAAIGISGAAAMDSALPFVKENCRAEYIKYAVVSGFILTLVAPFFLSAAIAMLN